jgi:hypothetical protein
MPTLENRPHARHVLDRALPEPDQALQTRLPAPQSVAGFTPLAPVRLAASTLAAIGLIAFVGVVLPASMRALVAAIFPPAPRTGSTLWVLLALVAGYW